ncbi:alpha-mannosidase [Listeria rocourtiae]|uniref:glycoside hydrolase family 38 N-terminal domain-containing protein n=1 Tax=Listeria rocourtiae TaxID=647910 RepID=UPI0016292DC8|nr:glycoside hydrolase family 38 C-terminal domain-containing protein [Listeria rocourtiae]MBC1435024.1 alpha-mannosidase [Listeria rocourtiae]
MKFNIISHTHWDREWHKTFEEYRVRLVYFLDDLIDLLECDSEYSYFLLDGQTIVLEDYLQIKPHKRQQLEQLIRNGRIIIGPWYIQPDEFIPSGEMQIRNLLIGQAVGAEFGENMQVGYLPDSFGQSAQLPQLLQGFNIEYAVFWRGLTEEECPDLDFIWQSTDGSTVKTTLLADGYGNARMLNESIENNITIVEENIERLYAKSDKKNMLLMCGFDQRQANPILPQIVAGLNDHYQQEHSFSLSTVEEYLEEVFEDSNKRVISGEFRKGKYMRVHVSIGLTRSDIKQENYQAQTQLIKITEPLISFANLEQSNYPTELMNQAVKYTLQNQAHDSIANVCTDATHREMSMRYENAIQISDVLTNDALEILSSHIAFKNIGTPVVLFNLISSKRSGLEKISIVTDLAQFELVDTKENKVKFGVLSKTEFNRNDLQIEIGEKNKDVILYQYELMIDTEFKGFGYKTLYIVKNEMPNEEQVTSIFCTKTSTFTTESFTLQVQNDGTLSYTDRETGETFSNLNRFVENGNAGDAYDYSPPKNDRLCSPHQTKPEIEVLHNSTQTAIVKLTHRFDVPAKTFADNRSEDMITQVIESTITVKQKSRRVAFKTVINNRARNHRICVQFENNQALATHFSEQQFGPITRENTFAKPDQWHEEKWEERYYPIYPQQRYTGFNNEGSKMIILNKGLVTYEILDEDGVPTISVPLITTMDYMGKQDLVDRPGRRSGLHIPTPDSEMIGEYTYEYAVEFFNNEINIAATADAYQLPLQVKQPVEANGILADELILYTVEDGNIGVMAFKKCENSEAYILRLVNHNQHKVRNLKVNINTNYFSQLREVNFKEQDIIESSKFTFANGTLMIHSLNANEVVTVKLIK